MKLLDGGSKLTWHERIRKETYPLVYVLIPLIVILHIIRGNPWKGWVLIGFAILALAIIFRPKDSN